MAALWLTSDPTIRTVTSFAEPAEFARTLLALNEHAANHQIAKWDFTSDLIIQEVVRAHLHPRNALALVVLNDLSGRVNVSARIQLIQSLQPLIITP